MKRLWAASALAMMANLWVGEAHALTILPTFDTSIMSSPDAAVIESNINAALKFYDTNFINPQTVQIDFKISATVGGGQSVSSFYGLPVADYVNALPFIAAADPKNPILQSAAASVGSGNASVFPNSTLILTSAALSAVGGGSPGFLNADGTFGGAFDGIVTVNSGLDFTDTAGANGVNATATFQHEIDEVLGIGGAGSFLNEQAVLPNSLGVLDLYRYWAPGTPSFTTDPLAKSYFSFDGGKTQVAPFNQSGQGDAGDWADFTAGCGQGMHRVQDYAECLGGPVIRLNRGSPEVIALQGIGYDLAVPEPGSWALMLIGFGTIGAALRRRPYAKRYGANRLYRINQR